jgi:histidine triad (HIT) family protein
VPDGSCLFCRIVAGEVPSTGVLRTERTYAFRDIDPAMPTHVLVVPTAHIDDAAAVTAEHAGVMAELLTTARAVAEAEGLWSDGDRSRGYRLVFNVGPDALNSVPHLHLHVLGGRTMTWPPG